MRLRYLGIPVAAFALWFACGRLSTKRTDTTNTSSEKTTATATAEDCLSITEIEGQATVDRFFDLKCDEKAVVCEADADCVYGGGGGCEGPSPLNAAFDALASKVNDFRGRSADCAVAHALPKDKLTLVCQNKACAAKIAYQKKDGSAGECVFGAGTDCQADDMCASVYFGDKIVDIREYAVDDANCPVQDGVTPPPGRLCFQFPGGNTNPPTPPTYQRTTPFAACQIYTSAASK